MSTRCGRRTIESLCTPNEDFERPNKHFQSAFYAPQTKILEAFGMDKVVTKNTTLHFRKLHQFTNLPLIRKLLRWANIISIENYVEKIQQIACSNFQKPGSPRSCLFRWTFQWFERLGCAFQGREYSMWATKKTDPTGNYVFFCDLILDGVKRSTRQKGALNTRMGPRSSWFLTRLRRMEVRIFGARRLDCV